MNWEMTLTVERNKGREEGRKEGRAEGRKEGRAEGRKEGREEGDLLRLIKLTQKKCSKGYSLERIAEELEENTELIEPIYGLVRENGGASPQTIYELYAKERGR